MSLYIFLSPRQSSLSLVLALSLFIMPRSFLVKKSKKGGFRSSLPIADVPYLGLVGWSVPVKVTTLPEEPGQGIQPYSPIMQQNSTLKSPDNGWKTGIDQPDLLRE